jgi:hypothetical protein
MGSRASTFKKGGGFLNNVDLTWLSYRFTDDVPSKEGPQAWADVPKKIKGKDGKTKERFHALNLEITVLPDGAKEAVTQSLFAGGWDDYVVSEDGLTLTAPNGGEVTIGADTAAGKLIITAIEAGFPEEDLDEDPNIVNFEPMVNRRYRLVQRRNDEATRKYGKRVDKKNPKRSYDLTDLVVDQYYGVVEAAARPTAKAAAKSAAAPAKKTSPAATTASPSKKANGKATAPAAEDVSSLATTTLLEVLSENDNSITKTKLGTKVLQRLMKHPQRDDIRTWLFNDDNLAELSETGVTYDPASGVISVE